MKKIIFLFIVKLSLLAAPLSYTTNSGFSGSFNALPYSTGIGFVIGIISTVTIFKLVRNLLVGGKRY